MAKQRKRTAAVKKRNPQDSTLRNVRALKKRVTILEAQFDRLLIVVAKLENVVARAVLSPVRKKARKKR